MLLRQCSEAYPAGTVQRTATLRKMSLLSKSSLKP